MKNMWNERYAQEEYSYGTKPNKYLKLFLENQKPGKILLPAEGEGRNAVFAARKLWNVHAFDFSEKGKEKALALASHHHVNIHYDVINAEDYQCHSDFDIIALIFAHFHPSMRKRLFKKLIKCLKPGGYWLMEVFSKKQLGNASGGPKTEDLLYSLEEMDGLLPGLSISSMEETRIVLDEGQFHQGPAEVLRVIAQKKL